MALSKAAAHHRARVAGLSRDRKPDDPDLVGARLELRALRLEDYVAQVLAEAPPLTNEQRSRIAALLRAGAPPRDAA
jgi:hypothetical protein